MDSANYITEYWAMFAIVLVGVEVLLVPGVGIFFAGLSAFTIAILLSLGVLSTDDLTLQLALFLGLTGVWAAVLWKPLKRWFHKKNNYQGSYAGTQATIQDSPLIKGEIGLVRWSGTNMRARIADGAGVDQIEAGTTVWVHNISDGILLVDIKQ